MICRDKLIYGVHDMRIYMYAIPRIEAVQEKFLIAVFKDSQ